ncbi:MAG TPA: M48 family metallopeptidase [Myxococcota bacterium]|nr:M48 family metallopeptidase [Myxococcota bacterium]
MEWELRAVCAAATSRKAAYFWCVRRTRAVLLVVITALVVGMVALAADPARVVASPPVSVPEPSALALRWYRTGVIVWIVGLLWGITVPAALFASGLSARLAALAQRLSKRFFFVTALYALLYTAVVFLLGLPFDWYATFLRPHAYGLSSQTEAKWISDALVSFALGGGVAAALLWVPYLLISRTPRLWWLWLSLLCVPFICFVMIVEPVWVAPLYNHFGPMKDTSLEEQILGLAERAGIEGGRVFQVDKSVDTKMVNAYVNGLGATKRIVLWDTLLAKLEPDEVLAVMAHEMGHYVLNHVLLSIPVLFLGILVSLYAVHRTAPPIVRRFGAYAHVTTLKDVASLPLVLVLVQLYGFLLAPLGYAFSRHLEHEADRFSLEITRDNHAMASALAKLQTSNLSNPRPAAWLVWLQFTHPPLGERIDFANHYRPWDSGVPLRYAKHFRDEGTAR